MKFTVAYMRVVSRDLSRMRPFDREQLIDRIEEQLTSQPLQESRNRKVLAEIVPPWEHNPPVWELRVGEYRVFYDVDETARHVTIRAIRRKPPHKTTEDIL